MKKTQRILEILGIVLLLGLYLSLAAPCLSFSLLSV